MPMGLILLYGENDGFTAAKVKDGVAKKQDRE